MMTISIQEVIDKKLGVVDMTASILCMEQQDADAGIRTERSRTASSILSSGTV